MRCPAPSQARALPATKMGEVQANRTMERIKRWTHVDIGHYCDVKLARLQSDYIRVIA